MGDIELQTPSRIIYKYFPNNTGYLKFQVRAPHDAQIAFSSKAQDWDPMYEIHLGSWSNQRSVLRKNRIHPDKVVLLTPDILHQGEFRTFWVWWGDKTIACGAADNLEPFLIWRDKECVPVNYIGVCTAWGSKGSWIIHQSVTPPEGLVEQVAAKKSVPRIQGKASPIPVSANGAALYPRDPPEGNFKSKHHWVFQSKGAAPETAFIAGDDEGEIVYVIRSHFDTGMTPGKLITTRKNANIPWEGLEHIVALYEVLCDFQGRWVSASDGFIPPNALACGYSKTQEPFFIGRICHMNNWTVGRIHPSHKCCYVPYNGKELSFTDYEVLVE